MTTEEKIIRKSIAAIDKRLAYIEYLLNFNYIAELRALRNPFLALSPAEAALKVKEHIKAERKLEKTWEKSMKSVELIEEKVKLELELANLNNRLYWIERTKIRNHANKL